MRCDAYKPRLLQLLAKLGEATTKQLAMQVPCSLSVARSAMRSALKLHEVHVVATRSHTRVYAPGPPIGGVTGKDPTVELIIEEIKLRPSTVRDLMAVTGKVEETVQRALKRIRARSRQGGVYICGYRRKTGKPGREAAVYAYGWGKQDVPRPDFSDSGAVSSRAYRERRRVLRALERSKRKTACQEQSL